MEIEAIIKFKHGKITSILRKNRLNIKQVAEMAGWKELNLGNFIRFKCIPINESKTNLFNALKKLDNNIEWVDIYPPEYDIAKQVLHNKRISKSIDFNKIEYIDPDQCAIEDKTLNNVLYNIDKQKTLKNISNILEERDKNVLFLYFGIGCRSHTLEEIANLAGITRERIRDIKNRALKRLKESCKFHEVRKFYKLYYQHNCD